MKEEYYTTNNVAGIVKILSIVELIIGVVACIICNQYLEIFTVVVIVISIIISIFIYAFGELIGIMHDIRTNSEHIRDYLERENKNNGKEN